ncbi:MAG TPA: acyl-CoA dehydrogenase family protein [Sphingopyxis sp.]|nr:acyl-CoA dehydrogenase family protein [Sphingopyxis sp.]HMP44929.1 acyl-CoA dehydrogenase family protein [Sphingopyxis sp.]HMQ18367.1 acyl-CoA dehydrogenase family protein [Sphingopyxis sp.]
MSDELDLGVLAGSFAEMLGAEWPREKAIAWSQAPEGFAAPLWNQMAELGWTALTVPEDHGGLGLGTEAAAALHAALGAAAAPVPMLGTTLATTLVAAAGNDAQKADLLPRLADGSLRAAVAQPGDAVAAIAGGTANATIADMVDSPSATTLFLRASRDGASCWLVLPAEAPGVSVADTALTDATRTLGTVTLDGVAVDDSAVLVPEDAAAIDDHLLRTAAIAIAADAIGGGEAALAGTIDYLKVREQFGRVIGSFQALKHRIADHQAALVAARGLVEHAASLPAGHPHALLDALSAKQHVTRTVAEIARDCIQLHGGVGFTAEFFPHIYLKRGKLNEALWGTRNRLLDRIADMLEAA